MLLEIKKFLNDEKRIKKSKSLPLKLFSLLIINLSLIFNLLLIILCSKVEKIKLLLILNFFLSISKFFL